MKTIPKDTKYEKYKVCRWCKGRGEAPLYQFYWPCLECEEKGYTVEVIKKRPPKKKSYLYDYDFGNRFNVFDLD